MAYMRHIGLTVSNLEESLKFYVEFLGFKVLRMADESGVCIDNFSSLKDIRVKTVKMIDSNNNMLELLHYDSHPEKPHNNRVRRITEIGCSHFALTITDLDSLYTKLINEGVEFNYPVQISPDGKVKVAFCRDPDGTLIEMVEEL
jgi:catechol 2,3-dioxygenase-like lactoylglutathione lyase family enzyme